MRHASVALATLHGCMHANTRRLKQSSMRPAAAPAATSKMETGASRASKLLMLLAQVLWLQDAVLLAVREKAPNKQPLLTLHRYRLQR